MVITIGIHLLAKNSAISAKGARNHSDDAFGSVTRARVVGGGGSGLEIGTRGDMSLSLSTV